MDAGPDAPWTNAVVANAQKFQFAPGQVIRFRDVASRDVIWGVLGRGEIRSPGLVAAVEPGTVVVLPWNYQVTYVAAPEDPFLLGALHIIPWHEPDVPVEWRVAHGRAERGWEDPARADVLWPGFERAVRIEGPDAARIIRIGEAVIDHVETAETPRDEILRAHGTILVEALLTSRHPAALGAPPGLAAAQHFVRSQMGRPIRTEELAAVAGCSVSTLERWFRRYLDASPQAWIRDARLAYARTLLTTTRMRIGEVARRSGFDDPLHFSRLFRRRYGAPPRTFIRRSPLV
jgi:AraC-like DNA-binding protein